MGFFNIYPNYNVVLIGPTGRVRKTSAADVAKALIHSAALCPIMADKITPESLASCLEESGQQFIYAPEFAVLFGKQRYNEGLTTLIIRLLDCPDSLVIRTIARGEQRLDSPTINMLGCSTLSLIATSTPQEVSSSGFLNRFVLVVEDDTERCFETPARGPKDVEEKIFATLKCLQGMKGEVGVDNSAQEFREEWYHQRWKMLREVDNETTAEVIQRGDIHMRRTAMLVHLSHCSSMQICLKCMETAANLIAYIESKVPQTVHALTRIAISEDVEVVFSLIKKLGGAADHSTIIRRLSSRMNARQAKGHIQTLAESGRIRVIKQAGATFYRMVDHAES